ncbi:glucan endo-1,3-alpha-glucosidase agn1 [Colletotrichum salicis]|uniref:Glucan endo-1,3-alpha-glucosidase agn1 n=1 Tax=Colletotrichum salicis TaxID=1209931 RepID=A0A135RP91_9PEZI|nr:glucan endo-1,3-alpha-glucosidase agn1 [Colletotrichum salicis]
MATASRKMTAIFFALWTLPSCIMKVDAKAVFAHFMVGNTENYAMKDFEYDISLAQQAHIDGFALNMAYGEATNVGSVDMMFDAAQTAGFKLIFSFDYAGRGPWPQQDVIDMLNVYSDSPAYFRHSTGQPLVSTFEGPGQSEDWVYIKEQTNAFFMPSWSSLGAKRAMQKNVADGLFSWGAWPEGPNDISEEIDASYVDFLGKDASGNKRPYMMPVSPWFYTNLPGYRKNWLWRGDSLWFRRWSHVWHMQPEYVQIISWNDYGESHHIGPINEGAMAAFDIGEAPFNYALGMPHDAWRMFLPFVIDTYKTGKTSFTKEGLTIWYRQNPGRACSSGGTVGNNAAQVQTEGDPANFAEDKVFFTALLSGFALPRVRIGEGGEWTNVAWGVVPDGGVGLYHGSVPFNGKTGFVRVEINPVGDSNTIIVVSVGPQITTECEHGMVNWNPWVGGSWSSRTVNVSPKLSLSEMLCTKGTGEGDFQEVCEFTCAHGYCPPGPCTCNELGGHKEEPKIIDVDGFPAAGKSCVLTGLCSWSCNHGNCPKAQCSTDKSLDGKCVMPVDEPEAPEQPPLPTPTPSKPAVVGPENLNPYNDPRWLNSNRCLFFRPPNQKLTEQPCLAQCQKVIDEAKEEGRTYNYGCIGFYPLDKPIPWIAAGKGAGGSYDYAVEGKCSCDNSAVNLFANTVLEALPVIAQIGCFILMSTLKIIFELGTAVLPVVGQAVSAGIGVRQEMAIDAALTIKHAYDSDQDPAGAFDFWLSPCGNHDLVPEDIRKVYGIVSDVSGAITGWRAPKNIPKGSGRKGDKANPTNRPSASVKPTKTADNCKRQAAGNNCPVDITSTRITASTPYVETITKTCIARSHTQACFHYYSAMVNYGFGRALSCTDDNERPDGLTKATKSWKDQHKDTVWRSFTKAQYMFKNDLPRPPRCEADEWPPAYFLPANYPQNLPAIGQVVRWVPGSENGGAGHNWLGFCANSDGGAGNGQVNNNGQVNQNLVKLKGQPQKSFTVMGGTTTTYLEYEADFTRAVMTLDFDWTGVNGGLPPDALNDWGLYQNPCWPLDIATGDPGYVLLTEDKWYATAIIPAADKANTPRYRLAPADGEYQAAKTRKFQREFPGEDLPEPGQWPWKRSKEDNAGLSEVNVLEDGKLALHGANSSRRLSEKELQDIAGMIECGDPSCSREVKAFGGRGVVIPAVATTLATVPSTNLDTRSTEAPGGSHPPAPPNPGAGQGVGVVAHLTFVSEGGLIIDMGDASSAIIINL